MLITLVLTSNYKTVAFLGLFDVFFCSITLSVIDKVGAFVETKFSILQESIASEYLERLLLWIKNIKISDPLEEDCKLGPIVSSGQVGKCMLLG